MLNQFARDLRCRQTDVEQKLWSFIRNKKLCGHKFRRQHPIGRYIADFVCIKRRLIIELDGGVHVKRSAKDFSRSQYLRNIGFRILRYKNEEILTRMNEVLAEIKKRLEENTPHSSLSPFRGERKMNE